VAIKTEWFQTAADADVGSPVDPFDAASSIPMGNAIHDLPMQSISLDMPMDQLEARAAILVKREGRFYDQGITCAIKDLPDMSCLACPFSKADDPENRKCGLCKVGREQDIVGTYMIAKRARSGGR
jgi:hypothetical protein